MFCYFVFLVKGHLATVVANILHIYIMDVKRQQTNGLDYFLHIFNIDVKNETGGPVH